MTSFDKSASAADKLGETEIFRKRKVFFVSLLCLNILLFVLYKSIPFSLPQLSTLALDSDTLIHYMTENQIKPGLQNGPILMNLDGVIHTPDQETDEWIQNNRVYLVCPSGKARCEAQLFFIRTRNPSLFVEGKLIFDTLYPSSGAFGFGAISALQESVFLKDGLFYYWKGPHLIEVFQENKGLWIPFLNTGYRLNQKESEITLQDKWGISRIFQAQDKATQHFILNRTFDALGNFINYRYNQKSQIIAMDNGVDKPVELQWNSADLVESIKTDKGIYTFKYNSSGNYTSNSSDTYNSSSDDSLNDSARNLHTLTFPGGQTLELQHESATFPHKITGIKLPDDSRIQFHYTLGGKLSKITTPQLQGSGYYSISLSYGKNLIILTLQTSSENASLPSLSSLGEEKFWLEYPDPLHFTYYKAAGAIKATGAHKAADVRNESQYRMNFTPRGHLLEFQQNETPPMLFKYDDKDNLIWKKVGLDVFEYQYDPASNILCKIKQNDEIVSQKIIKNGLVISEMKKNMGELHFEYDAYGNITSMFMKKEAGEESLLPGPQVPTKPQALSFRHDALGLITEVTTSDGSISKFGWKNKKLVHWQGDFGSSLKFNHNELEECVEMIHPNGSSLFDQSQFRQQNLYLSPLLPLPVTKPQELKLKNKSAYDFVVENESGQVFTAQMDPLRRITNLKYDDQEISYHYTHENALSQVAWSKDNNVFLSTNAKGRLQSYMGTDGSYSNLKYSPLGHQVINTEGEKDLRSYEYDKHERLTQMSVNAIFKYKFNYGPSENKAADAVSQIYEIQYADGTKIAYQYNTGAKWKGKLESILFKNTKPIQYRYTENSEEITFPNDVKEIREYDLETNTNYKAAGAHSVALVGPNGQALRECMYYFKDGKWVSGLDQGRKIALSYDSQNRVQEFSVQSLNAYQYTFNTYDNPIEITRTGKNTLYFQYNHKNKIMALVDSAKKTPISTINVLGNMIGSKLNLIEINGMSQIVEDSSAFQFNNFLITSKSNTLNIKGVLTSGASFEQALHFNVHPQASVVYEFNANRTLRYKHQDAKTQTYSWSVFNQLKSFRNFNGETFKYSYLPNGNRASSIKTEANGIDSKHIFSVYDIYGNLIEELSSTGTSLMKYVYDYQSNRLLFSFDGKNIYYYHTDSFGSVIQITNTSGNTVAEYLYSPYGQILYKKETIPENKRGFLGLVMDTETGCYLTKQGYYDPDTLMLYPNAYHSPFFLKKILNAQEYLLPRKPKIQPLDNPALKPLAIPFELSFEKEFMWVDLLPNVSPDIVSLKKYLTTAPPFKSKNSLGHSLMSE